MRLHVNLEAMLRIFSRHAGSCREQKSLHKEKNLNSLREPSVWRRCVVLIALMALALSAWPALGKRRASPQWVVVLDPGHGGTNSGAYGVPIARYEKYLTLHLARLVARRLRATIPTAKILLTRYDDSYVTLRGRVTKANAANADAFVSLHFNASEDRTQRGFETYVLNKKASDREAERVAHAENRAERPQSRCQYGRCDDASSLDNAEIALEVMSSFRIRAAYEQSSQLAASIQANLATARPNAPNRGVREGPFDVLMGLNMPGALVEVGFVDHAQEGPEIVKPHVQRRCAAAIAAAIASFLSKNATQTATKR